MYEDPKSWNRLQYHVLSKLNENAEKYDEIKNTIEELKHDITEVKQIKNEVKDIKYWKDRINEILTPKQLAELVKDVDKLKMAKVALWTAVTIGHILLMIFVRVQDKIF